MILLLPGNYKTDISLFNSIYSERKILLADINEVNWFCDYQSEQNLQGEKIDNITHKLYSSTDQYHKHLTGKKSICFADHLNIHLTTFWENTPNCNCFYFHHKDQTFKKVEQSNLFIRIFDAVSPYKEMVVEEKFETESIEDFKHIDFNIIFYSILEELNHRKKFYSLSYKEKYFLNKFISLYESRSKRLVKRVSAFDVINSDLIKKELRGVKTLLITGIEIINKQYLFQRIKLFPKHIKNIFLDCGDSDAEELTKIFKNDIIKLPDSSDLFNYKSDLNVLLLVLKESSSQHTNKIFIKSYAGIFTEGLLKDLNLNKCRIPELIHSLQILLPDREYTVDIMDYGFWYQLFLNITSDGLGKVLDVEESVEETNKNEEVFTQVETQNTIDKHDHPNRMIKGKESIKIYFKSELIHLKNSGLDGLFYIYYLISQSDPNNRISAATLRNIVNGKSSLFGGYSENLINNNDRENQEDDQMDYDDKLSSFEDYQYKVENLYAKMSQLKSKIKQITNKKKELKKLEEMALELEFEAEKEQNVLDIKKANKELNQLLADKASIEVDLKPDESKLSLDYRAVRSAINDALETINNANYLDLYQILDKSIDRSNNKMKEMYYKPITGIEWDCFSEKK